MSPIPRLSIVLVVGVFAIQTLYLRVFWKSRVRELRSSAPVPSDSDPLAWMNPFHGPQFTEYAADVDEKIEKYKARRHSRDCAFPLYAGEFGYELAGMVPWAYSHSQHGSCNIQTQGLAGTKYLYYFSDHTIITTKKRKSKLFPQDCPLGKHPHFNISTFEERTAEGKWVPPPYGEFYRNTNLKLDKPLVIISNKYTNEWTKGPVNYIPLDALKQMLDYLTKKYYIVYIRFQNKMLGDKNEQSHEGYGDKLLIKRRFPQVALYEQFSGDLSPDELNLFFFYLYASSHASISVQGGNSVVASFFGGTNIIYAVKGPELLDRKGDFSYYHKFSNATIEIANNGMELVQAIMAKL